MAFALALDLISRRGEELDQPFLGDDERVLRPYGTQNLFQRPSLYRALRVTRQRRNLFHGQRVGNVRPFFFEPPSEIFARRLGESCRYRLPVSFCRVTVENPDGDLRLGQTFFRLFYIPEEVFDADTVLPFTIGKK